MSAELKAALAVSAGMGAAMREDTQNTGVNRAARFPTLRDESTGEVISTREDDGERQTPAPAEPAPIETPTQTREDESGDEPQERHAPVAPPPAPVDAAQVRAAERQRIADIRASGERLGVPETVIMRQIDGDVSLDAARAAFAQEMERSSPAPTPGVGVPTNGLDENTTRRAAMSDHLQVRFGLTVDDPARSADYRGMNLLRLCEDILTQRGERVRGMSSFEVASRAFAHVSGDFAAVLMDAADKRLRAAYSVTPQTFGLWTNASTVSDFKNINLISLGNFPGLKEVPEGAEIEFGSTVDGKETAAISKFARALPFTLEMIINDDLRAFGRLFQGAGDAANRLESDVVYGLLKANAALSDGKALFHADHGNLLSAANVTEGSLQAGWEAMAVQKGLSKNPEDAEYLGLLPRYILHGPKQKIAVNKQLAATTPAKASDVQAFTSLQGIEEPRLNDHGTNGKGWYMTADPAQIDTVEILRLEGQEGPAMFETTNSRTLGMELSVLHFFGAKGVDYRGMTFNTGS